jgi:hypothetical protein
MFKQALIIGVAMAALVPVAASAGEVQNRINNENGRINQGVNSGNLTYGEYHRLDGTADRIQAQRNGDLRANGGHLTPAEYHRLNREENNLSDRIYFDKHNAYRQR